MVIVMAVDRAAGMEEVTAEIMATTMQQPAGLTGGKTKLLLSFAIIYFSQPNAFVKMKIPECQQNFKLIKTVKQEPNSSSFEEPL